MKVKTGRIRQPSLFTHDGQSTAGGESGTSSVQFCRDSHRGRIGGAHRLIARMVASRRSHGSTREKGHRMSNSAISASLQNSRKETGRTSVF